MAPHGSFEGRIFRTALLAGLPGVLVALSLLWFGDYSDKVRWTLTLFVAGGWLGYSLAVRERVVRPLQTVSNLLAALREGDYSIRARAEGREDALGEVVFEVNALSEGLREQRLGAMEATALLRTVMAEIDVAIFTLGDDRRLRLVNKAGERLLGRPPEQLLGREADELGLAACVAGPPVQTLDLALPGATSRFSVRRTAFREHGLPHTLLVLSDLSRELREEERQAWRRIIRVIGHELNNSLAPIKSIAASLEAILDAEPRADDWEDDVRRGLAIVGSRAEALSRFMQAYARLAKLPPPARQPVPIGTYVRRVAALETRLAVDLVPAAEATVSADPDQLEQALINLVRNAVDAALETGGGVRVGWRRDGGDVEVSVEDDGPGLANTANLFVPFFTTKPGGSGIGLAITRQIAEGHGGSLSLENRPGGRGCVARLRIPCGA